MFRKRKTLAPPTCFLKLFSKLGNMVLQSLNLVNNVANIKFKMCKGTILTHKYLKILFKRNKNSNQFKYIRNKTAYHCIILPIHMPIQLTFLI